MEHGWGGGPECPMLSHLTDKEPGQAADRGLSKEVAWDPLASMNSPRGHESHAGTGSFPEVCGMPALPQPVPLAKHGPRALQEEALRNCTSPQSLKARRPENLSLHKTASHLLQCTEPGAERFCLKSGCSPSFLGEHGTHSWGNI